MAGYTGAAGSNEGNWKGGGGSLGLTTGTRWSGNTAYGPSGGMASGYASRDAQSLRNAGMGPSMGSYGQFMTPQGSPMFSGALGGSSFFGRNAPQALSQALRAARANPAMATGPQPAAAPITQAPLPPLQQPPMPPVIQPPEPPPFAPPVKNLSYTYRPSPYPAGMNYANYFKNPTSYPQWSTGYGGSNLGYYNNNTYPGGYNYTPPDGSSYNLPTNRSAIDRLGGGR